MPMPQYNGSPYGYNPYQTYLPQSPWQGPQQDRRRDHVEGRHSRAAQAHQGEPYQVVDHVDRLMRR